MLGLSAVTFGLGCLGFRLFFENVWPFVLSGPVLLFLGGYSFTKRFTKWSHFYLGVALSLSPLAAWIAISPTSLGWEVLVLMSAVALWVGGFDIIYSCQDIDIDRREGLYSLPSRLGPDAALWIARSSHALAVVAFIAIGRVYHLGMLYALGVAMVAVLLVVENSLVRPGDYSKVNVAFFTINGVVSLMLGGLAIIDILVALPSVAT
jgi:4-hydroxybenzoate polyprenyltransferase